MDLLTIAGAVALFLIGYVVGVFHAEKMEEDRKRREEERERLEERLEEERKRREEEKERQEEERGRKVIYDLRHLTGGDD